jgi:hypothetical protein
MARSRLPLVIGAAAVLAGCSAGAPATQAPMYYYAPPVYAPPSYYREPAPASRYVAPPSSGPEPDQAAVAPAPPPPPASEPADPCVGWWRLCHLYD